MGPAARGSAGTVSKPTWRAEARDGTADPAAERPPVGAVPGRCRWLLSDNHTNAGYCWRPGRARQRAAPAASPFRPQSLAQLQPSSCRSRLPPTSCPGAGRAGGAQAPRRGAGGGRCGEAGPSRPVPGRWQCLPTARGAVRLRCPGRVGLVFLSDLLSPPSRLQPAAWPGHRGRSCFPSAPSRPPAPPGTSTGTGTAAACAASGSASSPGSEVPRTRRNTEGRVKGGQRRGGRGKPGPVPACLVPGREVYGARKWWGSVEGWQKALGSPRRMLLGGEARGLEAAPPSPLLSLPSRPGVSRRCREVSNRI